jgi:hypothetical protein
MKFLTFYKLLKWHSNCKKTLEFSCVFKEMKPMNNMEKNQVSKSRYFVFYLTSTCFTFIPIVLSIVLLFSIAEGVITKRLDITFYQHGFGVIGLVFCVLVPLSIGIGWLFLRLWIFLAAPAMTREEIRRFIERGLGMKA